MDLTGRPRNGPLDLNDSILHLILAMRFTASQNCYHFAMRHGLAVLAKLAELLRVLDCDRDGRAFEARVTGEILGK
jgi:hypothetical protein